MAKKITKTEIKPPWEQKREISSRDLKIMEEMAKHELDDYDRDLTAAKLKVEKRKR